MEPAPAIAIPARINIAELNRRISQGIIWLVIKMATGKTAAFTPISQGGIPARSSLKAMTAVNSAYARLAGKTAKIIRIGPLIYPPTLFKLGKYSSFGPP